MVVVDVVAVVVVVAAAAAAGWSLLCSAAAVGVSAAVEGRLDAAGAAAAAAVIVAAGGGGGGSGLLPSAAGDGKLRFGARAGTAIAALNGHRVGRAAGLTDGGHLRSLLDCGFLLGLLRRQRFTGRAGEQDQVIFGLRNLADVRL